MKKCKHKKLREISEGDGGFSYCLKCGQLMRKSLVYGVGDIYPRNLTDLERQMGHWRKEVSQLQRSVEEAEYDATRQELRQEMKRIQADISNADKYLKGLTV